MRGYDCIDAENTEDTKQPDSTKTLLERPVDDFVRSQMLMGSLQGVALAKFLQIAGTVLWLCAFYRPIRLSQSGS